LVAQSAVLASSQTSLDQAEAQLKHANDEYEAVQTDKYKNFAAIKEQAQFNKDRAENKLNKAREAAYKQRSSHDRVVQLLAGYISQGTTQTPSSTQHDDQIAGLTRDLALLSSRIQKSDLTRDTERGLDTNRVAELYKALHQTIESVNERFHGLNLSVEGITNRLSQEEAARTAAHSSDAAALARLDAACHELNHQIDQIRSDLKRGLEKASQETTARSNDRDATAARTSEEAEARLRSAIADLESRLQRSEDDRPLFARREELDSLNDLLKTTQAEIKELWAMRTTVAPGSANRASEQYGVVQFSPVPPMPTEPIRVNGHTQEMVPHALVAEIDQLKAAMRSHRQRLDNLTTDHVVRQMVEQLQVLYPNAKSTQAAYERFQREVNEARGIAATTSSEVKSLRNGLNELRSLVEGLTNARQDQLNSNTRSSPAQLAELRAITNTVEDLNRSVTKLETKCDESFTLLYENFAHMQDRLAQGETLMREHSRSKN
jgi:predicted  nucleic acid-binding Zn-ribbon protein